MKKIIRLTPILFTLLLTSCFNDYDDHLYLDNENEILEEEVSPNDPKENGLAILCTVPEVTPSLANATINTNLPDSHDLSSLMPPVRSQGAQGSCVAWATTYYLKSYQEKIEHGYDYDDFGDVMSPAFIYNQTKVSDNCALGSCIEGALYKLKTAGACSWTAFPYNDYNCSLQPNSAQFSAAISNRISQGYKIEEETTINTITYSREEIMKNLIQQGYPIIIGMELDNKFMNATPRNSDNIYIYETYNSAQFRGRHAMLIVGYDNNLNAFKVVNSWGTGWGNQGYCWISYNFFKKNNDANFIPGLLATFMAYDL